jgi:signal transduction histidine kinase/ligand-binding sensor domain-containing protein
MRNYSQSGRRRLKAIALRLTLLASIAVALCGCCLSQPLNRPIGSLYHTVWKVRDGVPNDIVAIQQTRDGYLWLGTGEGLFRFDGVRFERYQPNRGGELFSGRISALLATKDGGLWIAHQGRGVRASFLKDGEARNYASPDPLHPGTILAFAQSPDGTMWAATDYGLERLEGAHWIDVGQHYDQASSYPETVFVDHRGTLWVNTRAGLLYRPLGQGQFRTADATLSENVDIVEAPDGSVWMASIRGWVRKVTGPDGSLLREYPLIAAKSLGIAFTHDGALWIATVGDGLLREPFPNQLPTNHKTFEDALEHYTARDGLGNDFSDTVFEDRERNVWVTSSRGLDQFRWSKLIPIELAHGATYISMAEDPSGGLIVGSESLMRTVDGAVTRVLSPPSRIECVYRDPFDRVWLGGVDGLWRLSANRFLAYPLPRGLTPSGHNVQAMTLDRFGSLWVSFDRNGIYRLKGGSWTRSGGLLNFPTDPPLIEMTDAEGRTWFGYRDNLLAMLDGTKISLFTAQQGVNIGNVISIYEAGGRIWIGGDKRIEVLEDSRFHGIRSADAEALKGISGITSDAKGDMWLNGLSGVVHIKVDEIQRALANHGYSMAIERLDDLDGLVSAPEQIRPLPSVVKTSDGRIYFATRSSVVWIDPRQIPRNTTRPTVDIQSVNADGKTYDRPKELHLKANTDNLEIRYTAPSLLIPERVRFRYFMEGLDKRWIDAGDRRMALYSRVPPGKYVFKVIASNDEGLWSESARTVNIDIPPSFIQSIWFQILCGLVILLLLSLVYVLRFRQVNAQIRARIYGRVAERERIARELHDTLLQGVLSASMQLDLAEDQLAKDSPVRGLVQSVLATLRQVTEESRMALRGLRLQDVENNDLAKAFQRVKQEFPHKDTTVFRVVTQGAPRAIRTEIWNEIYRIGREAIVNAYVHSEAKTIEVEIQYARTQLSLLVRDDGRGIDSSILQGGRDGHWGLSGMRERSQRIGATLILRSRPGAGTEVELVIPDHVAFQDDSSNSTPRWLSWLAREGFNGNSRKARDKQNEPRG